MAEVRLVQLRPGNLTVVSLDTGALSFGQYPWTVYEVAVAPAAITSIALRIVTENRQMVCLARGAKAIECALWLCQCLRREGHGDRVKGVACRGLAARTSWCPSFGEEWAGVHSLLRSEKSPVLLAGNLPFILSRFPRRSYQVVDEATSEEEEAGLLSGPDPVAAFFADCFSS